MSGSFGGGPEGSLYGKQFRRHGERQTDRALAGGTLSDSYSQIEDLLLSYGELVNSGRIKAGDKAYAGLGLDQSRLGRGIASYEDALAAGDPVFAQYRKLMADSLNFDENGLPADLSRSITQGVRGSAAARGLLDSSTSGLQEVAALMGGSENIRAQRLSQVNQYLGGVTQGAISSLFPGIQTLYGGELQRAMKRGELYADANRTGAGVYGSTTQSLGVKGS